MNYFSQPKGAVKPVEKPAADIRVAAPVMQTKTADVLSTFGPGMVITGNIVCAGGLQIFGRVSGEIPQRVIRSLGIDRGRRAAVAQVVSHDVTSATSKCLTQRVGLRKHGRSASEQHQRRRQCQCQCDAIADFLVHVLLRST